MDEDYFKFFSTREEEERLDFENLKPCRHCGKPIPANATMCLYCGRSTGDYSKKSFWSIVITVSLIISFIVLILLS